MYLCIYHTVWSKLGELVMRIAYKINGNTLNSVNFGSGSHSIGVAVLIWNALFQPWLRLILCNSKPHHFCSWNWRGLRNSHSSEVICRLWGTSIPWHALPSCSFDCQIRNLTRAWDDSLQVHGPGFCLERCTGLILMLKDRGTHQDTQAGKDTACISSYHKNIYTCYSCDLPLPAERRSSAKPEIHELLNKRVLYEPRDLEFLLHLWDQFLQADQSHQHVQFLQEGQAAPFPPVGVIVLKIIRDWY